MKFNLKSFDTEIEGANGWHLVISTKARRQRAKTIII